MTVALIGSPTRTNIQLAFAWRQLGVDACVLWPAEALEKLGAGDTAIGRLDVLPTLDGIEPGIASLEEFEGRRDIRLLNCPKALLACHDKLATAERLREAGLPHPWTLHIEPGKPLPAVPLPCVLKPRFGSWGQDVLLARTIEDLVGLVELISGRPWWKQHGALLQELVSDVRRDVRIVVAGDRVVAGGQRIAGPDEWRTNVTLGGKVVEAELPPGTSQLAIETARAIGIDFAGVDLLPTGDAWTVLELNGAVDFDTRYALPGVDPYPAILAGLGISASELAEVRRPTATTTEGSLEMSKTLHGEPARAGDEIVITGHAVGAAPRTAVILEVLGEAGTERFRVRWEDGHESIFFPGEDAIVRRLQRRRTKSAPG
jgi:RimK family alpha-L-glutamate ligase